MKKILGFVGHIGCGKGVASEYLAEKYGASSYRFSTMLRDILNRLYIPTDRDNLIRISEVLRENFGEETLARVMKHDVENDAHELVCVDGIRRLADIGELRTLPGFVLVYVAATPEVRYKRIVARSENAGDHTKTFEEFLADETRSTETSIDDVAREATIVIDNDTTIEDFYHKLDELVHSA
ncbi:MAG: AAA family ATPase [Candidatus Magasanikbacteria bacterium]|nr:AAA family ATPase [Candidatus Magasanikbacteria bacterium]